MTVIETTAALEPWSPAEFTSLWRRFMERWAERDQRMDLISRVVRGDWSLVDPADKKLKSKSPNLIHVGLYDTAASAAMVPTVRVAPSNSRGPAKKHAAIMERLGASYLDAAGGQMFFNQNSLGLGAYGFCAAMVTCDPATGPSIQYRDPACCYPEPDMGALGSTNRVFFARQVYVSQLPEFYRVQLEQHCAEKDLDPKYFADHMVTLVEYNDAERVTVGLSYKAASISKRSGERSSSGGRNGGFVSVIVEDYPNPAGMCLAAVSQLSSLDDEPRGQYDQVVGVMQAHIRLMALALEYADQAVWNPMVVIDPIGEINDGPDGWIELGPNGKLWRVPPATMSFSFFEEMSSLIEGVHVGSRWPKNRSGEVSQSQASGKFMESSMGVQNAVIMTHHMAFERFCEQLLRIAFKLDKLEGPSRTVAGSLRNQLFLFERDADDIDLGASVSVDYGAALGMSVSEASVIGIQLVGSGLWSQEDAQENIPGIYDIARTRARILSETLEKQALAKLHMAVEAGKVDDKALIGMLRKARDGVGIEDLFKEFIIDPQEAAAANQLTSGITGGALPPGPQPMGELGPGAGPVPPPAPSPQDALAGILGGGAGQESSSINRLSVPLGPGSFAGTEVSG